MDDGLLLVVELVGSTTSGVTGLKVSATETDICFLFGEGASEAFSIDLCCI